jgi:CheY-like chemotaxis protein
MVAREQPDLLVSDIGMPKMDGFTLLTRLRALESDRAKSLPAIALTAFALPEDCAKANEVGFACHVSKPVEPAEFILAVARALRESAPGARAVSSRAARNSEEARNAKFRAKPR